MNARSLLGSDRLIGTLILLTATAAAPAAAGPGLDPVFARSSLSVACASPRVPGFLEIGRVFNVANPGRAYALRNEVQLIVTRACHRGADHVLVTLDEGATAPAPRLIVQQQ
ncbi:MAG TPA: hypothetical protein VFG21_08405 [Xanthomonadaceae bacterium]|nr:hypothetical protein [Xanthomonadaceae bacterium]